MAKNTAHNRYRLADKMVYSLSEQKAAHLKHTVLERHRKRVHTRKALIFGVALFMCGALLALFKDTLLSSFTPTPNAPSSSHTASAEPHLVDPVITGVVAPAEPPQSNDVSSPTELRRAVPLTPGTHFSVEEEIATRTYRIETGSVRFETHPGDSQRLLVRVDELLIEDIGTIFTVEKLPEHQVRVAVSEGRVLVSWPTGRAELKQGADGVFSSVPTQAAPSKNESPGAAQTSLSLSQDWRTAAKQGRNQQAATFIKDHPGYVKNNVEDLMLAADVMRLTGHSTRAVSYLQRVVKDFPKDPGRAPAAFSLGKVYLNDLGMPTAAARAFAIAAQNSPLTEEATAREAEAWHRANQPQQACRAAKKYLQLFPHGARAHSVRVFCE